MFGQAKGNTPPVSAIQPLDKDKIIKVSSPEELSLKITFLTEQLTAASPNGTFSSDIINIRIESNTVPDLSIVDLPGIIRTTTVGQSKSIINEVDSLLESFITQSRTIILAVIPANQDVATIDVLERAAKFDPMGSRTIGVLTKPDLVDQGAEPEVLSVMQNLRKPLALGYVMVKNRNQNQLNNNLSLQQATQEESNYFTSHPEWCKLDKTCLGVISLSNKLTKVLVYKAQESLPIMMFELKDKLAKIDTELVLLGDDGPDNELDQRRIILKIVSRFGQTLRQIAIGEYRDSLTQDHSELRVKYSIEEIIKTMQKNLSLKNPNFNEESTTSEHLMQQLNELRGRELPGFMSVRLLLATASSDIDVWRMEVESAISRVIEVYSKTAGILIMKIATQYPNIIAAVMEVVKETLHAQSKEMMRRTDELFEGADATLVDDKDFIASINKIRLSRFDAALEEVMQSAKEVRPGKMEKEELKSHLKDQLGGIYMKFHAIGYGPSVQVEDIRAALGSYWHAAENRLNDSISSTIDLVLLKDASEVIEQNLLSLAQNWTSDSVSLKEMISENREVAQKRVVLKERRDILRKAVDRMNQLTTSRF